MKKQLFVLFAIAILFIMVGYSGYSNYTSHEVKKKHSLTGTVMAIYDKYIELSKQIDGKKEILNFNINKDTNIKDQISVGQLVTVIYHYEKKGSKYKKIAESIYPASKIE